VISADRWRDLAKTSEGQPWSTQLTEALPLLVSLSAEDEAATEDLRAEPTVVSHRDVVPENILWGPKASWLIDWEAAAWTNRMVELVSVAIDWSGYIEGRTDQRIFAAVLEGYRAIAPFDAAQALRAVPVSSGSWLRWLAYNITRAAGEASSDDDRAVGLGQIGLSLRALAKVRAHRPLWQKWIVSGT
jgi:Ser/Thr protein kinase RdoA (MazF antagonist)